MIFQLHIGGDVNLEERALYTFAFTEAEGFFVYAYSLDTFEFLWKAPLGNSGSYVASYDATYNGLVAAYITSGSSSTNIGIYSLETKKLDIFETSDVYSSPFAQAYNTKTQTLYFLQIDDSTCFISRYNFPTRKLVQKLVRCDVINNVMALRYDQFTDKIIAMKGSSLAVLVNDCTLIFLS